MDLTTAAYLVIFLLSIAFLYDQATKRIPSRLDSNQAPKSRFELVPAGANGLPTRKDGFDIIFVHGLGSNPDTTWRATKLAATVGTPEEAATDNARFVNWVSDFLPADILEATNTDVRIFFYNYDSYWKRDAVHTRLANLGNELLEHINGGIRMSEMERSRNLIFVAHSFGGLVVKRALVQAQASRDFGHIAEHTKSIFFLGTPHRGTSFGSWGWLAAQALQPLGSNPLLLANLEYDSISLHDFHKEFMAIAQDDLCVFNFFEKRPTRLLRLWFIQWQQFCVREQSATYEGQNVRNIGLSVDHYGLNKFGSRQDVSYKTILAKLVEVTKSPTRSDKRHYAVPLETVHTYTERAKLSAELEQKLQTRHEKASISYAVALHGLGGAGKSQLALAYAEKHKDRYNPILWIDATDEEAVRSSFKRCAAELGLPEERAEKQESVLTDGVVQAVLRWLRDRTEADNEWLVIVDNADDVSWGIQKIMPKGNQGSVIVTSRDNRSVRLVPGTCESVHVDVMSPVEGVALLLKHLQLKTESALEEIQRNCDKIAQRLGYLALAIDLAGAYIGNDSTPKHALSQYLADYDRHCDELLQMDGFQGLLPTEKTVWTVWDTTLQKIRRKYSRLQPELLLTFLAQFKGSIVQDESFRLACLVHLTDISENDAEDGDWRRHEGFIGSTFGRMYYDEGRWSEAEKLFMQVMETRKTKLGADHLDMLTSIANLASTFWNQGRWEEAEKLFVQVMETRKTKLGADHPDTLNSMANLASTYRNQGRWDEAEKLDVQVMETSKTKLGADHPDTLTSIANLASTFWNQGRWDEAEKLFVQVMETSKTKLGADHPDTLTSIANLALTFWNQGRWEEAEKLFVQVMETRKTKLGADHPDTLNSMANLASTLWNQGRWEEAEKLFVQVMETSKTKLGADHPDTLTSIANLALTFWNQGRWDEAEKLFVQVMETRKTKLGADHPDTLNSMANLASTFWNQGRWDEAEKLDVQVMETRKTKLGADHPDTLMSMHNLAFTWKDQGRHADALALMEDCTQARRRVLGEKHPHTLFCLSTVAKWSM
ncbi:hypothetical protein B0H66DRAFT_596327 [Apodospora peruviana]|uniref:GPI inositol-deacylase n=1 Tax=Apodospora peruviana TaxID=516989 RepID=A0AAE0IP19_9PEZI|nr:hypothetical protein B0H66DRAFT_596327 [Apodospora peruviana]